MVFKWCLARNIQRAKYDQSTTYIPLTIQYTPITYAFLADCMEGDMLFTSTQGLH